MCFGLCGLFFFGFCCRWRRKNYKKTILSEQILHSAWAVRCSRGQSVCQLCHQSCLPWAAMQPWLWPERCGHPEVRPDCPKLWGSESSQRPGCARCATGALCTLISMLAGRRLCGALALLAQRAPLAYQLFLLLTTMSSVSASPGSCARRRAQTAFPLGMPTWPPDSSGTA